MGCSVYLVGFTEMGIVGVLIGTIVTEIVRRPILIFYVSKKVELPVFKYLLGAYILPILYSLTISFIGSILLNALNLSWISFFIHGLYFACLCGGFARRL